VSAKTNPPPRATARIGLFEWLLTLVPRFIHPRRLVSAAAFSPMPLLLAFALTWVTFAIANSWLSSRIDETFDTATLPEFNNVSDKSMAAKRAEERKWADPKIHEWLKEVLEPPTPAFPASKQTVALFQTPGPGGPPSEERLLRLRRMSTGTRLSGVSEALPNGLSWLGNGFWIDIKTASADEIVSDQAGMEDNRWSRSIEGQKDSEEKKKFTRRYIEGLQNRVQEPIRDMRRINGWVQWFTVYTTFLVIVTLLRRLVLIVKLRVTVRKIVAELNRNGVIQVGSLGPMTGEIAVLMSRAISPMGVPRPEAVGSALEELQQVRTGSDAGSYGVLNNLVAVLPALGFLGTVIGMGDALLKADGLFSSQEKQQVIGLITQDLGFAFDTTLVSLICAPIAGVVLTLVRLREQQMFADYAGLLAAFRNWTVPVAVRARP